jgi:biopolymer transport protein ExbD
MVDLGFLLITFFIVTAKMLQPNAIKINIPSDGDNTNYAKSKTLNMLLLSHNKLVL